MPLKQYCTYLR